MQIRTLQIIVLASTLTIFATAGLARTQDGAKQDIKAAGTDTKSAAKDTGHAVSAGTKKTYNKTALTALDAASPGYHWQSYLAEVGVADKTDYVIVGEPSYFKAFGEMVFFPYA